MGESAAAAAAPVQDPAQVPAVVAAALGVREQPDVPAVEVLARVLARQQLLVLDNCEHVIGAATQMCAGLLAACDDVRVLTTSRELLRLAGEARYRLGPVALPGPGEAANAGGCGSHACMVWRTQAPVSILTTGAGVRPGELPEPGSPRRAMIHNRIPEY